MLPFSGQGANLAIEESGLLGEFFRHVGAAEIPAKIERFGSIRRKRIVAIKLLSRIRFGKENDAAYSLIEHDELDSTGECDGAQPDEVPSDDAIDVPRSFHERLLYEWRYESSV